MSFTVPSEHPDHEGSQWNVEPTQAGTLHASHSGTLEHFTAVDKAEAEAGIAANEARYTGKDVTPEEPPVEPAPEPEPAPPTQ